MLKTKTFCLVSGKMGENNRNWDLKLGFRNQMVEVLVFTFGSSPTKYHRVFINDPSHWAQTWSKWMPILGCDVQLSNIGLKWILGPMV